MADTGAPWALPFPVLSDEADAPRYIQALAQAVAAALSSVQAVEVIQRGRVNVVIPSGSSSAWINVIFPQAFSTIPTIALTVIGTSGYRTFTTTGPAGSNINVGVYTASGSNVGANSTVPVDWIAIGGRPA